MIDKQKIKDMIGCDDKFLAELLEKFISESIESMDQINKSLAKQDWDSLKGSAHKMLSSTRIFEMDELTTLFKKIEILATEQVNTKQIHPLVDELNTQIKITFNEIRSII
ncbi:MAG: Hpt domain-containing protein [Flavobacteriales bacterium]|nr:Hpt domain-containing protein [Flavobacteriales bacterium]